jgi:hypothetical protein
MSGKIVRLKVCPLPPNPLPGLFITHSASIKIQMMNKPGLKRMKSARTQKGSAEKTMIRLKAYLPPRRREMTDEIDRMWLNMYTNWNAENKKAYHFH